jgi:hypothetical protein
VVAADVAAIVAVVVAVATGTKLRYNFNPLAPASVRGFPLRETAIVGVPASLALQCGNVASGIFGRIFGSQAGSGPDKRAGSGQRIARRSTGFNEFIKYISKEEDLRILDLGATSPANITFMTGLGHKFHQEDLLRLSAEKDLLVSNGNGGTAFDADKFLRENLNFEREEFDAVMFWDLADYLPEPLVKPVIERVHVGMKPGSILLGYFHTKDAGPKEPFYRYHIASKEAVDMQPGESFKLQRVFTNRHVENLFRDFASIKFFLGRDNLRDVLVIR